MSGRLFAVPASSIVVTQRTCRKPPKSAFFLKTKHSELAFLISPQIVLCMEKSATKQANQRNHWCNIRLTEDEFKLLHSKLTTTTCRKISDYVRNVLFEKPVTVRQRNQSLDDLMDVLILLRNELNYLGNNFNQVVKKLNSIPASPEYSSWLPVAEDLQNKLLHKIDIIQSRIDQIGEQWLGK